MSEPAPIIVTALFGRRDQGWFDAQRAAHDAWIALEYVLGRDLTSRQEVSCDDWE